MLNKIMKTRLIPEILLGLPFLVSVSEVVVNLLYDNLC